MSYCVDIAIRCTADTLLCASINPNVNHLANCTTILIQSTLDCGDSPGFSSKKVNTLVWFSIGCCIYGVYTLTRIGFESMTPTAGFEPTLMHEIDLITGANETTKEVTTIQAEMV